MAIPNNLLPINNPFREEVQEDLGINTITQKLSTDGVPNNLLPVNASSISSSLQSLAGAIPEIPNLPQIPKFPILNVVLPDTLFLTGSIDQIRARTLNTAKKFINGLALPKIRLVIPTIPLPVFPPKRPSYGDIKTFIKTKVDRLKAQRQRASIKTLNAELEKQKNPFTYRQQLRQEEARNAINKAIKNRIREIR